MEQLVNVLEKTVSVDKTEIDAVKLFLEQAQQANTFQFMENCSQILRTISCSDVARMQAGLQLKNLIYSKDNSVKHFYTERWLKGPEDQRDRIKDNCLVSIGTEITGHSTAAQCVAYIACIELPLNLWPDLMSRLVQNVIHEESQTPLKQATLETIGYICQDIDSNILSSQSNEILTAIINGMKVSEPSDEVRLAASTALLNSIDFIKRNFSNPNERNFIMQVICECTQSGHVPSRVVAIQCLVKIMSVYYVFMEQYMSQALFAITLDAIRSDIPEVALQGIEFWSTVCDEEIYLQSKGQDVSDLATVPRYYAKGALRYILPLILQRMSNKDENDDEDEWNPVKAAGVCLVLLALACLDDIVPEVKDFIAQNITNPDWRFRDAACYSFGAIMEGPSEASIAPLIESAFPTLIVLLQDKSCSFVRDSAAWTIGRIFEAHPLNASALTQVDLQNFVSALIDGLSAEPRVAVNVCWAINHFCVSCYRLARGDKPDDVQPSSQEPKTFLLTPCYYQLTQALLNCSDRPDYAQHNLRNAAYTALMELMRSSACDVYSIVQQFTVVVLDRLKGVLAALNQSLSVTDRANLIELQSLLCGTLESVIRRIASDDAIKIGDVTMDALLRMLIYNPENAINSSVENSKKLENNNSINFETGVQEDALLAISSFLEKVGADNFMKYISALHPLLLQCCLNGENTTVCSNAIGLISDLARVLQKKILPYSEPILFALMQLLTNINTDKSLRPQIISVFGDFAMALEQDFHTFLSVILSTLQQASMAKVNRDDVEMVEYLRDLHKACIEAYSSIIQGLRTPGTENVSPAHLALLQPALPSIFELLTQISKEEFCDDVVSSACGLIGDLVTTFGASIIPLVEQEAISNLLNSGRRAKSNKTRTVALWALKEIRKFHCGPYPSVKGDEVRIEN